MSKRILPILSIAAILAMPIDTQAQSLLKGLREKAEKAVGGAVGSLLGDDSSDNSSTSSSSTKPGSSLRGLLGQSKDNSSSTSYHARWDAQPLPRSQNSSKWNQQIKPCTASDVNSLLAAFPAFPTAQEIASNDESHRNYYNDCIYAVKLRIEELRKAVPESKEDLQKSMDNYRAEMLKQQGLSDEAAAMYQTPSQVQNPGSMAMLNGLEAKLMANPAELQRLAESMDMERIEALSEELNKIESKKNPTAADKKRVEAIQAEMLELCAPMIEAMGGMEAIQAQAGQAQAMDKQAQANASAPRTKSEYDKRFEDFTKRFDAFCAKNHQDNENTSDSEGNTPALEAMFQKLWSEPSGSSEVKNIYAQIDAYIANFYVSNSEARIQRYKALFEEAKKYLEEAKSFASNVPSESYYPKFQLLRAPYEVLEECANILSNVYYLELMNRVNAVVKTKVNLPLIAGDQIVSGESFCRFMTSRDLSSITGSAAPMDNLEEEFINKAVILVYNSRTKRYYKIEGGRRSSLSGTNNDFFKKADYSENKTVDFDMNNLDAKIKLTYDGYLYLPDGSSFAPLAVQRTKDWLIFIDSSDYDGVIYKCMFRL